MPPAVAKEASLSSDDQACQKCHDGKKEILKTTEAGESLSMMISTQAFLASMHNDTSCTDCHDDLDEKTHGKVAVPIKSKRAYRLSFKDSCTVCHKKNMAQFKDSVHAAMVADGNDKAPTCSDCHDPHTLKSVKLIEPIANVPCAACHKEIFKAYSQDVHGLDRVAHGKEAPLCANCHSAHSIKAASLATSGIKEACLSCHKDAADKHLAWLPNSKLHFEVVSCPVCHNPTAKRRVNLRLVDSVSGKQIMEKKGESQFEQMTKAADASQSGLAGSELRSFLKQFNQANPGTKAILSGRLEVREGVENHQISEKEKALKDCKVCHESGAMPFQSVILTMAGSDGRPLRHVVNREVLNSVTALDMIRGFYTIGSSRLSVLDYLLVLVLLGVLCVPIAHLTAHRLFKTKRDQLNAERARAAAQADRNTPQK
ncbi:cytochrome c3 family protein [Rhodoferax sp.]|uniref:cytochrome c3 family protein n=1 Tax=Rhodoferax sp. TaxID=50421 RepID=UPI00284321D7|nr:cytochrome c3 family protein [Rhodoferax sp.]MDR3368971.1 cytochrome c3 family protein [Rhodoferax sp.]